MFKAEDTLKIASLARLAPSQDELLVLTKDSNAILEYVRQLETLDLTGVQPMSHVHGVTNVLREDEPEPSLTVDEALSNAIDTHDNFFKVPIIIE